MSSVTDTGGPGMTVPRFLAVIPDREVRALMDPQVLSVLDVLYNGKLRGDTLRRIAPDLLDFDVLLSDVSGRANVLRLLPRQKRDELADRIGRRVDEDGDWTANEIRELCGFFGLSEERIVPPPMPPTDIVEPKYALFDHQRDAVRRLMPLLAEDERRAVLHLPTGVGKTRTAMHVVAHWLRSHEPSVVVWLASGKELLEQAHVAFQEAWSHLGTRTVQIGSAWGDRMPDVSAFHDGFLAMGLAKAWSVTSTTGPGWLGSLASRVRLVVFDEAHQSIAPTYQRLTDELTMAYNCSLLGLTATPGRTWADIDADGKLSEYYGENKVTIRGDDPIANLVRDGYLARPVFRTLLAKPGVQIGHDDIVRLEKMLDIPQDILHAMSMSEQYVTAVLEAVNQLLANGCTRTLAFAGSVAQARLLTALIAAQGTHCEMVSAKTHPRRRARAIQSFRTADERPMVLVNYGVLTTGFDAPRINAVVIARPTKSLVLYCQMVGRGIRGPKAGGTESCEIVTVVDPALPAFGNLAEAFLNWEDVWTSN